MIPLHRSARRKRTVSWLVIFITLLSIWALLIIAFVANKGRVARNIDVYIRQMQTQQRRASKRAADVRGIGAHLRSQAIGSF